MSGLFVGANHAVWTAMAAEGDYKFLVVRHSEIGPDEDGKVAWTWRLAFRDAYSGTTTHTAAAGASDMIWTPPFHDSRSVLASLASFLSAWNEAVTYGDADSENRDLFPASAQVVLGGVEEFAFVMNDA